MKKDTLALRILATRVREIPAAALSPAELEKLANLVESGFFDEAISALDKDGMTHIICDNHKKAGYVNHVCNDLMVMRSNCFDPDVDDFNLEHTSKNDPSQGFEITLLVNDGNDIDEFKRQGYSVNIDEEATFAQRQVPGKWEICDGCRGNGKHDHPAFSNGITQSDREEMGEEDFEGYLRGNYDVQCAPCKGSGKVFVYDESNLKPWELKELSRQAEDDAAYQRERDFERRMGA